MDKKKIIVDIVEIANEFDKIKAFSEADKLTRIAHKLVSADWGDMDIGEPDPNAIAEIAYEIMNEQGIEGDEIPDDIWEQAREIYIENYSPPDYT
jgi:hypothetical protein